MKASRPAAHPLPVSLEAAAALFLERQHLDRPRGRKLTATTLARFAANVGGIQLDTINVVERAHHLTLWSRFGAYDRQAFDRLAYGRRVLFEYWAHAACLVPAEDFPMWRQVMTGYAERPRYPHWARWARKNRDVVEAVERAIKEQGPLGSADFAHPRPGKNGWWNRKPATHALDYLWMSGRVLVESRRHFHKRFDLAERVLPGALGEPAHDRSEFLRWHLRRSLHALGVATAGDLRGYLTFPPQSRQERKRALDELLESVEVVAVEVKGEGGSFTAHALAEDLPALTRAGRLRTPSRGTTLLSPFDSLLWHRERAIRLFGFAYKIQVYVPAADRRHGYYLMPILHDGQLIGRLDAKTERAERRLVARAIHFEPWFARGERPPAASWGAVDPEQAIAGLSDALRSLARFVGADRVTLGAVTPRRFAPSLRRALSSAPIPQETR